MTADHACWSTQYRRDLVKAIEFELFLDIVTYIVVMMRLFF